MRLDYFFIFYLHDLYPFSETVGLGYEDRTKKEENVEHNKKEQRGEGGIRDRITQ